MKLYYSPSPLNKKEYISEIGKILVRDYGKKKYYEPDEVERASKKSQFGVYSIDWALSIFTSHELFDSYYEKQGEERDYVKMKKEMLEGISNKDTSDWLQIGTYDIDASWLDLGDVFEGLLEGIGDFISGIFEGL